MSALRPGREPRVQMADADGPGAGGRARRLRSYVINLDEGPRRDVLTDTTDLFDRHTSGERHVDLPYITECCSGARHGP